MTSPGRTMLASASAMGPVGLNRCVAAPKPAIM